MDKIHSNIETKLKHATLDGDTPLTSTPCKITKTPYYLSEKNSLSPRMFFVSHLENCISKAGRDLDLAGINCLKFMIGSRGKDDCYIRVACVDIRCPLVIARTTIYQALEMEPVDIRNMGYFNLIIDLKNEAVEKEGDEDYKVTDHCNMLQYSIGPSYQQGQLWLPQ
jgi:hypothetical protein